MNLIWSSPNVFLFVAGCVFIQEGDAVINGGVRTLSVRFNTYNGQSGGLFSAVKIEAKFSLGESDMKESSASFAVLVV